MRKLFNCAFCGGVIEIYRKGESFILKEDIVDWDNDANTTKAIKKGEAVCAECLIDYIEDTERVPITLPQIEYKHIGVKDC